jgi:hypothetical protein
MLEVTNTFATALDRAREMARENGKLTAADQESLLALPGFDGSEYLRFVAELRDQGVEVEESDAGLPETQKEIRREAEDSLDTRSREKDLDLLDRYLADLGRYPPLTVEQERGFARQTP